MRRAATSLFSRFGVELEYMIVDARTLDVRPAADALLAAVAGEITGEVERGEITWSNELVAHVVEFKVTRPATTLRELPEAFAAAIREANAQLAPLGARLLPGGMHPWMDPLRETRLWPHEYNEVYEALNRVFDCRGHGWSNLQAAHLNLPFADDEEFGRLHAAIRLALPILPALAAASPVMDGRLTGTLDNRLAVYRSNSRRIPSITGSVVPEAVYTRADYETEILHRIYSDMAPHDAGGVLRHEWLNARGAIARFTRNTIEIRVLDTQECPRADLAILAAIVALLRALAAERFSPLARQQSTATAPLAAILDATIRDAGQALVEDSEYLSLLGQTAPTTAGALWKSLIGTLAQEGLLEEQWLPTLEVILQEGPLARRIARQVGNDSSGLIPRERLHAVYSRLGDCLDRSEMLTAKDPATGCPS